MNKDVIHNLIVLDESGSMFSTKEITIEGFNALIGNIKQTAKEFNDQEHFVSFISFNSMGLKGLIWKQPVEMIREIDHSSYQPNGGTPLYDALGFTLTKLRNELNNQPNAKVLVTVITDGEENASREFNGAQIRDLIKSLEDGGWTFAYLGADHDVWRAAESLNIRNSKSYSKTKEGIQSMFEADANDRRIYYQKVRNKNHDLNEDYFN